MSDLLPLFPLELVLFPGMALPLHIFEPRYKEMIGECLQHDSPFGIVRTVGDGVAQIGCSAEVATVVKRYDDGRMDIVARGLQRFELIEIHQERSFLQGEVKMLKDESDADAQTRKKALDLHSSLLLLAASGQAVPTLDPPDDLLSFYLISHLPVDLDFKQTILAMPSESQRLATLIEYYEAIIPKLGKMIQGKKKSGSNGHIM
ncbi:MAG: LON peptidase substrate-binding domain-containing protein [Acidobacteria bacterium]|nr:LON peptidase substrate-binding domain-containing protein [Acidobacteriota bacterium]MBV9434774.1 LON peptidase substrate-binding domain-containing protein [Acidobacteriota bacterium]